MNLQLIQLFMLVIVVCLSLLMGIIVLQVNRKSKTNVFYFFTSITISLWVAAGYLTYYDPVQNYVLFFARLNFFVVCLFFVAMFRFTRNFPTQNKLTKFGKVFTISGILISLLSLFSPAIISNVIIESGNRVWSFGSLIYLYYAYGITAAILSVVILFIKYKASSQIEKLKIKLILIGISLVAIFNVIFNIIIPIILPNLNIYWIGDYSLIWFLGFTAYAIMKFQLFNIKLIATEVSVVALSIGLLIETFISNGNLTEGLLKAIIWVVGTYGGWQLIKSVRIEIKQKEDLAKLAKELEEANEHLKSVDKLKDDFLSMASHELNTPIAAIEGYLSMILEEHMAGDLSPKAEQYLTSVFNSSKRLAGMVKDLLNVSRIESNRVHLIMKETQIADIITQVDMEIAPKIKQAKHTLIYHKPDKAMPLTWMDNTRITEVLINIIGNAIKYTPDGGKIEINTMCDDKKIVVSVKDNGKGIPKDKFGCVFEKFTQVDVLKDEVKGTGLGMYISKRFVELHKGKIWFTSDGDGKGSTFFFSIPVLEKQPFDPHSGEGDVLH